MRGEDGGLRAFLNVCRHRGAQLCPAERGQTRTLQCRYHAWTYGLDGRLLRAPGLQDATGLRPRRVRARPRGPRHVGGARVGEPRRGPAARRRPDPPPARGPARRRRAPGPVPDGRARGRPDPRVRGAGELEGHRRELHGVLPLRADAPGAGAAPAGLPERRDAGVRARHAPGRRRGGAHGERAGARPAVPGLGTRPRAALLRDGGPPERVPEPPPRPRDRAHADAARRRIARA